MKSRTFKIIALAFCFAMSGCHKEKQQEIEAPKAIVAVNFEMIKRGSFAIEEQLSGRTIVAQRNKIVTPVAGRIMQLNVIPGAKVNAGECLAESEHVNPMQQSAAPKYCCSKLKLRHKKTRRSECLIWR